ncbi:hypothetical protein HYV56_00465 [Candidatus Peregrinibacteria bacterium]|nr:hypothetical protein [Candidatus Peregrinibacteria bacterium]
MVETYAWTPFRSGLLRHLFYALLSLFIVFLTLESWNKAEGAFQVQSLIIDGEGSIGQGEIFEPFQDIRQIVPSMHLKTDISSRLYLVFYERTSLHLDRGTEIVVDEVVFNEKGFFRMSFSLLSGQVWVNNLYYPDEYIINFQNNVRIEAREVALNVALDSLNIRSYASRHSAKVELISPSGDILTHMAIAEGMEFKIRSDQITAKLSSLRYSKLLKEFLHRVSRDTLSKDEWISLNRNKDARLKRDFYATLDRFIELQGVSTFEPDSFLYQVEKAYYFSGPFFIFDTANEADFVIEKILRPLKKAQLKFAQGEIQEGRLYIQFFAETLQHFFDDPSQKDFSSLLGEKLFSFFLPLHSLSLEHPLYEVKNEIFDQLLALTPDTEKEVFLMSMLNNRLNEVYDLFASSKNLQAARTFLNYKTDLMSVLSNFSDTEKEIFRDDFLDQYQIVYSILSTENDFLEVKFFEILNIFDDLILELSENEIDAFENRLTFINNRLRILEKLITLFKYGAYNSEISLTLAQNLLEKSIQILDATGTYDVAVHQVFRSKMDDFSTLLKYFRSPEYEANRRIYSEESFAAFLEREKILSQSQSEPNAKKPVQRIKAQDFTKVVYDDFSQYDIYIRGVSPLAQTDINHFVIGVIQLSGLTFEAQYDREKKIVSDIHSADFRIDAAVNIQNFKRYIEGIKPQIEEQIKNSSQVVLKVTDEQEQALIQDLIEHLKTFGILALEEDIVLIDYDLQRFSVNRVFYQSNDSIVFSFVYDLKNTLASEIFVETSLGSREISSPKKLETLFVSLEEEYEKAEKEYDLILGGL